MQSQAHSLARPRACQAFSWAPMGAPRASTRKTIEFIKVFQGLEPETLIFLTFFKGRAQPGYLFSVQMCQNRRTLLNFWASRSSAPDPPDPPETQHAGQNRPWGSHAGGQDDGSLHKLLQIIHISKILEWVSTLQQKEPLLIRQKTC